MENYEDFKKSYFELSHINLDAYKEKQMKRRIETLLARKGQSSFAQYARLLAADKTELEEFTDYITINVTEFFRTPLYWHFLEEKVIPILAENTFCGSGGTVPGQLKIWSAGCSTGEEPYSLAMLLLKYFTPEQFNIFATDVDESVLKKAEEGSFTEKSMETIPEEYGQFRELYFEQNSQKWQTKTQFKICQAVKNQIEFAKLDITQEDFPLNCDLIVCRNVLIYFTEAAKQQIFHKFCESLKPGGILFLGHTEQIIYYKNFGLEKLAKNFYRKKVEA